ncbi:MAG: patatin-like phospholipase family protein [Alphaproteobacteria bacterium]
MVKSINLALQGGGSHGAFTWGVLDRILEDERLEIEAVSGASAGAMNAVVLAEGLAHGDRRNARDTLARFWNGIADAAVSSPIRRSPVDQMMGSWSLDSSPSYLWFDLLSRVVSPYDLNPFDVNPLRDVLEKHVNFKAVCHCERVKVFVSATNVETGRVKVFNQTELTSEHVLASACLPLLHKAIWIDETPYWDGGFTGNPPLWPLFDHSSADDVIIVQINPFTRPGAPRAARDIVNRLNEITFNTSLLQELRAVDFVTRLMDAGRLDGTGYRRVLPHMIQDEPFLSSLGASSKMNAEKAFLTLLFDKGRNAADVWLRQHFDDLGARPSIDIRKLFDGDEHALDGARIERQARFQQEDGAAPEAGPPETT